MDIKKIIKYIIFMFVIFSSITIITKSKVTHIDSLTISLIGTVTFAILDQYAPSYVVKDNKI
jgi:uncharacterized MnhB-related membrane protein